MEQSGGPDLPLHEIKGDLMDSMHADLQSLDFLQGDIADILSIVLSCHCRMISLLEETNPVALGSPKLSAASKLPALLSDDDRSGYTAELTLLSMGVLSEQFSHDALRATLRSCLTAMRERNLREWRNNGAQTERIDDAVAS